MVGVNSSETNVAGVPLYKVYIVFLSPLKEGTRNKCNKSSLARFIWSDMNLSAALCSLFSEHRKICLKKAHYHRNVRDSIRRLCGGWMSHHSFSFLHFSYSRTSKVLGMEQISHSLFNTYYNVEKPISCNVYIGMSADTRIVILVA